jgi:hypothetical protein
VGDIKKSKMIRIMKWRRVSGFAGPTYFSEDGQWTILTVKSGEHRLCRVQHSVGEFDAAAGPTGC